MLGENLVGVGAWSYLILIILSILVLGAGYWKCRKKLLFVHYFAVSGFILFFDYIIYAWGKAYTYHPNIIEGKFDTHIGALVNAQILPAFAVLYIAFQCKWYWGVAFAGLFTGIELLFRHWGIFKGHWWQPWITFVLLTPFFPFAKYWWNRLKQIPEKKLVFFTLLSVYYVIFTQLNVFLYGVLKLRTIHVEWIERLHRESTTINSPTGILFGTIVTFLIMINARRYWFYLSMIAYLSFDLTLKYVEIIRTEKMVLDTILSFITFLIPMLVVKYMSKHFKG
jgi:hypothetical protein